MFSAGPGFVLLALYVLFWVVIVFGAAYFAVRLAVRRNFPQTTPGPRPLDLLKERYVRGEISRDEFERMWHDIE